MHLLILIPVISLAPPEGHYEHAIAQIDTALEAVGTDSTNTTELITNLDHALAQIGQHPAELTNDPSAPDKLTQARLALVWLYLSDRNESAAAAAMDEALRYARGTPLPAGTFGPRVLQLYEERRLALEQQGTGLIHVDCGDVACQVVINERLTSNPSEPLWLGTYRVWIGASGGNGEWQFHEVTLASEGQRQALSFVADTAQKPAPVIPGSAPKPAGSASSPPASLVDEPTRKTKRVLPRWAELLGVSAGVAVAVGGAVALSYHGKCQNHNEPTDPGTCPQVWDSATAGYSMLGVGAGVLLLSGVVLTVDEVRVGKSKARQAMLSWTLRF